MRSKASKLVILIILLQSSATLNAQYFKTNFVDSTDNALDISNWLSKAYGVFPVANLITEPATGYGAVLGLIHIGKDRNKDFRGNPMPPNLTVLGGALTENGTWAAILYHQAYWKKDKIRFTGVTGYVSPNLSIFREGPLGNSIAFGFNMNGPILIPSISFRIKESNSFLGVRYVFMKNEVKFDLPVNDIPVNPLDLESVLSGLGVLYSFDTRDNIFTPNKGIYSNVSLIRYDRFLGSDQEYLRLDSYIIGFKPISNNWVLGFRFDYRAVFDSPPFYALPFVSLRGIPIMRYQGEQLVVFETEERWDFSKRWSLTGFAGAGKGFGGNIERNADEWAYSVGGGLRYLLAKKYNIYSGIDVARGPEEWAFYIQFGHYWNSL